ncbi:MAG: dTMP kinase [Syntrophorhabdaceae bacterium]|nr:dTMP kinase [Syntrophorhabdaceae bacterium]
MFITFEGIEGSGKSTQINLLYEYLKGRGYDVIKTREPGGTKTGEFLRDFLLNNEGDINPKTELLLIMAMRAQHVEEVIIPALKDKKIVLCDRFTDATIAYQGYGRGINLSIIELINNFAAEGITPDLTILIDFDVKDGLDRRMNDTGYMDRFEKEGILFHKRVRDAYLKLSRENKERFLVVDGSEPVEKIHEIIKDRVVSLIGSGSF